MTASQPLSRAQEGALGARIQRGDLPARDELVEANLRFVVRMAYPYQNRGLSLADLISAGNVGLLTAAERFDGTRGYKFISYAVWWIRQAFHHALAQDVRTVRLPLDKVALLKALPRAQNRLRQAARRDPEVADLAAALEVSVPELKALLDSPRHGGSLDEPFSQDAHRRWLDIRSDPAQRPPDAEVTQKSDQGLLADVLSHLDARQRRVLHLYFGFHGHPAQTLEQIGAGLGVTRERVRQIRNQALAQLRHAAWAHSLQTLVEE